MILRRTPQKSSILSRWDYQAENPLAAFKALCEKCIWGDFPLLFEYKEGSFKKQGKRISKRIWLEKAINNLQADFLLDDSRVSQSIRN